MTIEELVEKVDGGIELKKGVYDIIDKDKEGLFKLPFNTLIKILSIPNTQKSHPVLEEWLINKIGAEKVEKELNKGDCLKNGNYIECKASMITESNKTLNLRQVRLYQNNDLYYCLAVDTRNINDIKTYLYVLNHKQMTEESKIMKFKSTHKAKESVALDENVELSGEFTIRDKNEHFKRWNKYLIDSSFLKT